MNKYLKITTETRPCRQCDGRGWFWNKEYHNQVNACSCYKCAGTGKLEIEVTEDVTDEVLKLIALTKNKHTVD